MARLWTCLFVILAGNAIAGPVELIGSQLAKRQIPPPVPSNGAQMTDQDWAAYMKDLSRKKLLTHFMGEAQACKKTPRKFGFGPLENSKLTIDKLTLFRPLRGSWEPMRPHLGDLEAI